MNCEWTNQELTALTENYNKLTAEELRKSFLPNRSIHAIYNKAKKLGLSRKQEYDTTEWTQEELNTLRAGYGNTSIREMQANDLKKHSRHAILGKIRALKLTKQKPARPWTQQEDDVLQQEYAKTPVSALAKKLKRTEAAIRQRATVLGLSKEKPANPKTHTRHVWTPEDDEILTTYARTTTVKKLQQKYFPKLTENAIRQRIGRLNLTDKSRNTTWTDKEIEILTENTACSDKQLAALLPGKTPKAIQDKALRLGLHKSYTKAGHLKTKTE